MTGSAEGVVTSPTNQKEALESPVNDNMAKLRSSVLDFSASKALNWLANAALPKRQSPPEGDHIVSRLKSETFQSASQKPDSKIPANQTPESGSHSNEVLNLNKDKKIPLEPLSEVRKRTYSDAKISSVDCDHILSPSECMRSSTSSQTGFTSIFSTMAARLGETSANQSLTQSMTSSASSLVTKLTGIKLGSPPQKTYKKGVTEYQFEGNDVPSEKEKANENNEEKDKVERETNLVVGEVRMRGKRPSAEAEAHRNAKGVSFDIVNLFDKLLLPSAKPEKKEVKPVSKIPVPTNRWSWNFGMPRFTSSGNQPKSMPKASTDSDLKGKESVNRNQSKKIATKADSPSHKSEHFPKRGMSKNVDSDKSSKGGKPTPTKSTRAAAPPKPPRLVQSVPASGKKSGTSQESGKKNTATL